MKIKFLSALLIAAAIFSACTEKNESLYESHSNTSVSQSDISNHTSSSGKITEKATECTIVPKAEIKKELVFINEEDSEWLYAYRSILRSFPLHSNTETAAELIYFNDDDIPELAIFGRSFCSFYTFVPSNQNREAHTRFFSEISSLAGYVFYRPYYSCNATTYHTGAETTHTVNSFGELFEDNYIILCFSAMNKLSGDDVWPIKFNGNDRADEFDVLLPSSSTDYYDTRFGKSWKQLSPENESAYILTPDNQENAIADIYEKFTQDKREE